MDPGGPGSRAGRTFWTFWNYITDVVGRFLRAEPPGTVINAADNTNSTPTNDELLDSHQKKDNATEEEVHVVPASSVDSTRPVVLWDSGSALQPEMRQNVQEDDKINDNDDDEKDKEIETGNDVAAYLPISLTTMDNPEQSSDTIINNDKLMLVNSLDEMINIDIEVSKQYGSIETEKPQSKEQLNAISKEGFNEQKTSSAAESELTSEDTRTLGQKHCEQHDGKLLLSDNMDLGECVPIIEKQEREEAEIEESANVKSDRDGNKNAMEGTEEIEIKNMTDEDQYSETEMCLQTTHLELTRQNTCMIEVTDRSDEGLNRMNTEDMKKTHSLVLETENVCKQDEISEDYEGNKDDMAMGQNNLDIEKLERLSDMESLMSDNNYVIMREEAETLVKQELTVANTTHDPVKSEDDEKESEIQTEEIEMTENDNVTNKNATFDGEDENNVIINQDMTRPYTLEVTDGESSTEELKDMNKDDLNKLHTSLIFETENMSKQDDKNEVHDGIKDDTVLTQNKLDLENLEKLSDMESLMSENNYVIRLEENESLIKQELTVANITDDSVKSEDDEKESEIQKEESEMTEYDIITSQNAAFDSEDGNNDKETCPEPIVDLPYTLEVVAVESSTKEFKDMNKDDFNKLHSSLVLETENMSKQDDKNEVHDGNKDDMVLTQSNLDTENLERLSDMESSMSDNNSVTVLEENESLIKQELTVANTTDDSVKSEDDEKESIIQKEETEMTENDDDNMTNQNAAFDSEDGNDAKETCPALIIDKDVTQADTLEVADGESSTEQSNDMTKDDLNRLRTSLVLETENMSKQDDKNEVHDGNKDDMVLMQHNLDIGNLERLSDMESSMSDNNYAIMLEEDESLVKYERTVANTTDDSVKSEDDEKESEIQKEEIEMTENDDDNMTNKNATFESEDENNVIIDQDIIQPYTLEVADGESSTEESKDVNKDDFNQLHTSLVLETENMSKQDDNNEVYDGNKDDTVLTQNNADIENLERLSDMESSMSNNNYVIVLEDNESLIKQELTVANTTDDSVKSESDEKEKKIQKEESEMTEYDNLTSQNSVFDSEDGNDAKETCPEPIVDLLYTLKVADVESSTEESKDVKEHFNNIHTFLGLETENMSKQDDKNEVHDGNKDDMVLTQNNLDTENLERLSDMESSMSENNSTTVLEENENLIKQELAVANTTDDSVKSESDEKENEIQTEESEMTEYDNNNMTSQNSMFDSEDGNDAKETCPEPIVDLPYTLEVADVESCIEESKDMNKDFNKLHTCLSLETEILSILDNQTVQDESSKVQVTDDCNIIQEVEPSTSKQEHTAANGNEESYGNSENKKPGKMEQDIFEEESDNKDFKIKGITPNMEDAAIVGRETHISRCGLDFEGIFNVADPASSEMDSSMGKFDVIIKTEGGPTQEQAIAFKNISPGEGEGQERPYSYKESREEVPDYNNEPNNGSATQRFLEVANCRENQTTLLQEEVESRAAKHLQTSATSEGEDSLEDPMETQLIKNSLEEHIAEKTQLPDKLMKTASEISNFETNFVHADVEEKGEDLKEAKREIGFEMGKHVCDIDTADADVEIQTEFQNLISLDQSEYNVQMLERPSVEMQTTRMDLLDTEGLFTFAEEVTTVKKMSDGSSESVKSGSADEDCTTVSNDNVIPDGVHYKISPDALSVEDEHQKCVLEQQIFDDVIEDEILDLWIQHTSMESSEVSEEDQGHDHSQCKMPEEEKVESMPDLSIECDVNVSLFTTESGFSDQSLDMETSPECNKDEQDLLQEEKIINVSCILNKSEGLNESSLAEPELETPWREDLGTTPERTDDGEEAITSQNIDLSTPVMQDNSTSSVQMDDKPFTTLETISEPETLTMDQSDFFTEIKNTMCTTDTSETEECQLLVQDKSKVEALLEFERTEDIDKVEVKELDFTPQKSRIAVKNPRVRPPKDFRSLLHKPSLEPSPSKPLASRVPAGVPMGGLGIGIKLPGLGTGFPILKKTKKTVEEETQSPTQETEPVIEDDNKAKQEDSQQRPKWMPASHPGFGNPLLSELKSKLKKTTKE